MELSYSPISRMLGGILLVTGCCIGAGMLGLPVLSAMAGFIPSTVLFILCWMFMAVTGLLLLEVNLSFKDEVNVVTLAERTFGSVGKIAAWFLFLFLFYSLMVAYAAASGQLFSDVVLALSGIAIPPAASSFAMTLLFGTIVFFGTALVDRFNRALILGLALTYLLLITLGIFKIDPNNLLHRDWSSALMIIPIMIVCFGYHNLIPSLTTYLKRDVQKLRMTILVGSALPLIIYLLWEYVILGLVPYTHFMNTAENGDLATKALEGASGSVAISTIAGLFAFFAIVTSLLAVAMGLVDFLRDGFKMQGLQGRFYMTLLAFVPPYLFAMFYPNVFLQALNAAGGYFAILLFGVLPAIMAWKIRKEGTNQPLVPGGSLTIAIILALSCAIVGVQLWNDARGL